MRKAVVYELIDIQVHNVLCAASAQLLAASPQSADGAVRAGIRLGLSAELAAKKSLLEGFLYERVYRHPRLMTIRRAAQEKLEILFDRFMTHLDWLPPKFRSRVEIVGSHRSIAVFLAGMTDRYCESQHARITASRPMG